MCAPIRIADLMRQANAAPAVSLTSPADNTILTAPATFNLAASASSKRGRLGAIAKVAEMHGVRSCITTF